MFHKPLMKHLSNFSHSFYSVSPAANPVDLGPARERKQPVGRALRENIQRKGIGRVRIVMMIGWTLVRIQFPNKGVREDLKMNNNRRQRILSVGVLQLLLHMRMNVMEAQGISEARVDTPTLSIPFFSPGVCARRGHIEDRPPFQG